MRIPIATKTAVGRSIPLTPEDLINFYPEVAPEGSKSRVVVHGTPGTVLFSNISSNLIRGMYKMLGLGRVFVVIGTQLFELLSDGLTVSKGSIGGSGRVGMADNGIEVCITSVGISYVYDTSTETLSIITDSDFPNSRTVSFMGGYFVFVNSQVGSRDQFFISGAYDGTEFDALEFASAETYPDNLVREFVDHDQLILFGTDSTQFWFVNNPLSSPASADFPFSPIQGGVIEKGLGARWSVVKLNNSVVFVDQDGIVRRLNGYTPVRISDHATENMIQKGAWKTDDPNFIEGANAYSYVEEGHEFYVLTVPGSGTRCYDSATGLWHTRKSRDLVTSRSNFYVKAFDKHLVGDIETGKIYEQSLDTYEENSIPVTSEMVFPQVQNDGKRFIVHRFQMDMEVASRAIQKIVGAADPLEIVFIQQPSSFTSGSIRGVNYGNGLWVAVGDVGKIATSTDGEIWTQETSPFGLDPNEAVAYGNDLWVAVGGNDSPTSPVATSPDGKTWTLRSVDSPNPDRMGVVHGAGLFVIVASSGVIDYSSDGISWTAVSPKPLGSSLINDVAYNGTDLFVCVAVSGGLATSADGISWTSRTSSFGSTVILGVAFGNGVWVAVGLSNKIATSSNGTSWSQVASVPFTSGNINNVTYGAGLFLATADTGEMGYSADNGVTWTLFADSTFGISDIENIAYNGSYFIAVGENQKLAKSSIAQELALETDFSGDREVMLDVSGNTRTYDITQAWRSAGDKGEFDTRVIWRRLGQHRSFTPRITISAPIKRAVFTAYADIEPSSS